MKTDRTVSLWGHLAHLGSHKGTPHPFRHEMAMRGGLNTETNFRKRLHLTHGNFVAVGLPDSISIIAWLPPLGRHVGHLGGRPHSKRSRVVIITPVPQINIKPDSRRAALDGQGPTDNNVIRPASGNLGKSLDL